MKSLFIFCLVIFFATTSFSQRSPESFLAGIPDPPASACDNTVKEREKYETKVNDLADQLKDEISKRKEERQEFMDDNEEKMMQNMAGKMGLSAGDKAKMKKGAQISEADAMEMAEKMMGSQYNMSVGEAKSLSKMSKEGQEAWGEAYAAEMMANAQANPQKVNADMGKNKNMFDLVSEQKSLTDKLLAQGKKVQKQLKEMNSKDSIEKIRLDKLLEPLKEEFDDINLGEGSEEADWAHALAVRIKMWGHQRTYCLKMTSVYVDILTQYRVALEANLSDHYRLQEITDELMQMQTGTTVKMVAPDLMAFESLSEYVTMLRDLFQFYPGEEPNND